MVASALHAAEVAGVAELPAWLQRFDAQALVAEDVPPAEWTLPSGDVLKDPAVASVSRWPPSMPKSYEEFSVLAKALQALDRWHRPLGQWPNSKLARLPDHDLARARLGTEYAYGADAHGSIIPIWSELSPGNAWRGAFEGLYRQHHDGAPRTGDDGAARPLVLASLLAETAYMPACIVAQSADGNTSQREVRLIYRRALVPEVDALGRDRLNLIAIAPLLEAVTDVEISVQGSGYGVRPMYDPVRLQQIVRHAISKQVEVLLLPECSVAEENLEVLIDALLAEARAFAKREGDPAALRYVFAGVAGASRPGDVNANYVIVLDSYGRVVMRQHKLFGWDLSEPQIERFGLIETLAEAPRSQEGLVRENIAPASEMTVLDLGGLGRVIALICADMSFNLPGDWLMQHFRVDFLHAPIMDQTLLDLAFNERGRLVGSWIGDRAHRAACLGASRIAVSNSMALTQRLNAFNEQSKSDRKAISHCGIGLLIDGLGEDLRYRRVTSSVKRPSPVLVLERWAHLWPKVDYTAR